ncbi:MAG: GspE/PulE family protein, partial [Chitinivibrionales bacterium]
MVDIKPLGRILLDKGLLDEKGLKSVLEECDWSGIKTGEYLIKENLVSEDDVYSSLAEQFSMDYISDVSGILNRDLIDAVPFELIESCRMLPVSADENSVTGVIADPLDTEAEMSAWYKSGKTVKTKLTSPSSLRNGVEALTGDDSHFKKDVVNISEEYKNSMGHINEETTSINELKKSTELEPVIKMADLMMQQAISKGASDIHIEPAENEALIRFRIDGMLREYMRVEKWLYIPLTSRLKIMAELDIAEKRVPQDGRIRVTINREAYDLRVSTLPTHYGEKTVIRILKHDTNLLEVSQLGIPVQERNTLLELIEKPQGMLFVTGPTGSGKSSTLFACLNRIRDKEINITTIENPIEYKLPGINQTQINEKAGVTFAKSLRSILRQDPDVILVGEIRDTETANIAVQSSQTGHLVFSTLHTNDSVSAITRLRDFGIPPFLISSAVIGILAQRLVRKLCPECREKRGLDDSLKERWRIATGSVPFEEAFFPRGCKECGNRGYIGRQGIFELIYIDEVIRDLIANDASESTIRRELRESGFKTMLENGIEKVNQGIT